MNFQARVLCVVASVLAYGCHSSDDNDDDSPGALRPLLAGFNAVADMPAVTFLREEEVWATIEFGAGTAFKSVDADQYDVNFDVLLPGDKTTSCLGDVDKDDVKDESECTRLQSESINVITQHEYVVGLLGSYGSARVQVYDKTVHEFDTSTTDGDGADQNLEFQFFHWSDALGAVDVYLEPPGTNLSAVQVRGSFSVGGESHGLINEGTYVLTVSPVGNPSAPIYTSENVTLSKQTRVAFAILDGVDSTSPVKIARFRDQGGDLPDRRVKTELRLTHVAPDTANVDVFAEGDYSAALVANLALEQTSPYREIDAVAVSDLQLDITPAGNPGVLLAREQTSLVRGARSTFFLVNDASGRVDGLNVQDLFRRLGPYAQLRIVNSATQSLDFYVVPRGNNIYTSSPLATLSPGAAGTVHLLDPGGYDLVMARTGATTFSFGPVNVDLAARGLYTIVAVSTVDATRTDAILLDDFVP
jgi:hypothetical protein